MILTPFGDLVWGDQRALDQFLAAHDLKHQALAQAAGRLGVTLPAFLLTATIDGSWLQEHWQQHVTLAQQITQDMDETTYNLLTDPMTDQEAFYDWHDNHNLIHQRLDQAFGFQGT